MTEIERVRDQLERAFAGDAWHGPSLSELLHDVDAESASAHPIEGAHSIQELVLHIIAWQNEARKRLSGGGHDLPPEEDWPQGPGAWIALKESLAVAHQELMTAIGELDDSDLDRAVMGTGGTVYHLLHGVIQHNLYHGGQIAILRRAST